MEPVRLAQIGIGGYGAVLRRALVQSPLVTYAAVADTDATLCAQVAAETGARVATADAILADDRIAGVVLALPNTLHRPYTERAAAAGKHVFVEKPIANTVADGQAMIDACAAAGVQLMVGHNYRREAGYRQLLAWLRAGELGTVIDAQCESSHAGGLHLDPTTWRFDPAQCPALPLIQLGIHVIDLCNLAFGRPVEVTAIQRHRLIPGANVDATMTLIAYAGDVLVSLASHYVTPGRTAVLASGTAGRIEASANVARLVRGREVAEPALVPVDTQLEEIEEFARAVAGEGEIETTGEVGLAALGVCEAAGRAARAGVTQRD